MRYLLLTCLVLFSVYSLTGCNLCFLNSEACEGDSPEVIDLIPQEGLLAFYPLDGNAEDATGDAKGSLISGAAPIFDRFGQPNSAYHFDGANDHIDLVSSNDLKPSFPLTISMWVQAGRASGMAPLTNSFDEAVNTGVWIALASDQSKAAINYGNGGPAGAATRRTKVGSTPLEVGRWYHITGVIRSESDMSVYLNGVDDGGIYTGSATSMAYGSGPVSLGRRYTGYLDPPLYFEGAIDEVAFYNRALSASEVQQLYTAGSEAHEGG